MKFSHHWLQTFFTEALPLPATLADQITFHSSEVEEMITLPNDTIFDVKILPDKSAWLLSHRGLAKEISTILNIPLKTDPFKTAVDIQNANLTTITRSSATCDFYSAAVIAGVKVGPSPVWLKETLEAIGQRSINNIVDATNYVMFELGQPLHAFDASKLSASDNKYQIEIRPAKAGEKITTLSGETYELDENVTLITDGVSGDPIGIGGIKGGKLAAIDDNTSLIVIESAHFDRVAIRNTSKSLKLNTDAAKRFENGISVGVAPLALIRVANLIIEIAGGKISGLDFSGDAVVSRAVVSCSLTKINSVLGLSLTKAEVDLLISRFDYQYEWQGEELLVTPPFERDDLIISEDLIEEIGRLHGLDKIASIPPIVRSVQEYNSRHYYADKISAALVALGFSEVYTSSFRDHDLVKLENALASDKGYLRSTLTNNLREVVDKNTVHLNLLGLRAVKVFEIGTVFLEETEEFRVAVAVQSGTSYKAKIDEPLVIEAQEAIAAVLGEKPDLLYHQDGIFEFSLTAQLAKLPSVTAYSSLEKKSVQQYRAFSVYPSVSRDIAMWVKDGVEVREVMDVLQDAAGELCLRLTHLDTFSKEGRTSYAFRLVFQSKDKTLTDSEVEKIMTEVYKNVAKQGWEAR